MHNFWFWNSASLGLRGTQLGRVTLVRTTVGICPVSGKIQNKGENVYKKYRTNSTMPIVLNSSKMSVIILFYNFWYCHYNFVFIFIYFFMTRKSVCFCKIASNFYIATVHCC
jgi:hypothetical protein